MFLRHHPMILVAGLVLALAEFFWRRASGRGYDVPKALTSLGVALVQTALRPLNLLATSAVLVAIARVVPWHLPMDSAVVWVAAFFCVEAAYYWFHRLSHEVAWAWANHAVHHSAEQMVLPAAIRLGWTEFLSLAWVAYVPLVLIGFPPIMIGTCLAVGLIYQYGLHTEAPIPFGPLEWLLNSPTHHRVHHSRDPEFLDCNYGGVLIVFDRLFGTFRQAAPGQVLHYGLVHGENTTTVLGVGLGPWAHLLRRLRGANGWGERLAVAFGRPD